MSWRMTGSRSQVARLPEQAQGELNETGAPYRRLPMVSRPLAGFRQLNLIFNDRAVWRAASPAQSADRPARDAWDSGPVGRTEHPCSCRARSQAGRA